MELHEVISAGMTEAVDLIINRCSSQEKIEAILIPSL